VLAQVDFQGQHSPTGQRDGVGRQAIWLNFQADMPPFGVELGVRPRYHTDDIAVQLQRFARRFPAGQGREADIRGHIFLQMLISLSSSL
jgi:hypothetical protein